MVAITRAGLVATLMALCATVVSAAPEAGVAARAVDGTIAETPAPVLVEERLRRATTSTSRGTRTVTSTRRPTSTGAAEHLEANMLAYAVGGIVAAGAALI